MSEKIGPNFIWRIEKNQFEIKEIDAKLRGKIKKPNEKTNNFWFLL